MSKNNAICDEDRRAYAAFCDWLPYYYATAPEVPAGMRFRIALNGYPNAAMACVDIATHLIRDKRLARKAQKELVTMQVHREN